MPLSTIILWRLRRCRKCRHARSLVPATTGGSPLDKHPKAPSFPAASLCSKTTLDESAVNLPSKTFECSEGWPDAPAATPTNSFRHSLDDGEKVAPKGPAFAVDKLKEKLASVVARTEKNPKQSTHQPQPFARAPRDRIWSLIHRLLCRPRPDDTSDACDRPLEDPASLLIAIESDEVGATKLLPKETEKWYELSVTNLSANYDGPSGGQRDPDIDGETDTDAATATAIGTDTDSYTSVEGDINDGPDGDLEDDSDSNENLPQPLLETLYGSSSDHEREELMQAIRVDQLVTKAPIDPRRDLKGLCWPGIQRYTRELAEGIGKQLALEVAGVSTKDILDVTLNYCQTRARPFRSVEELRIPQQDLDQAKKALRECEQHHLGILSWLYLLRLQAQLDILPDLHSFPASSRKAQDALTKVLQGCTASTTANTVSLDRELLMACALRHRARIDDRRRRGHSIDAKIFHDFLCLRDLQPGMRKRWVIGETERLLGSHTLPDLGDAERMERCRKTLKLWPFASLESRYPGAKLKFTREMAIKKLQHEAYFATDFTPQGQDKGVYLYYCTLALATYGFEPPSDLGIELDYLLALLLKEMKRRQKMTLCLMGLCEGGCWSPKNGPSLCWHGTIN